MTPVNVLLVDDNDAVRAILNILLSVEESVNEVREATDGLDALEVCRSFRPDLVVLDFSMPGMNGKEAAGRIRDMHPQARIVAFSSEIDRKPAWADDYFIKGSIPDPEALIGIALKAQPESTSQ